MYLEINLTKVVKNLYRETAKHSLGKLAEFIISELSLTRPIWVEPNFPTTYTVIKIFK